VQSAIKQQQGTGVTRSLKEVEILLPQVKLLHRSKSILVLRPLGAFLTIIGTNAIEGRHVTCQSHEAEHMISKGLSGLQNGLNQLPPPTDTSIVHGVKI